MINTAVLVQRIKEEQAKLALSSVMYPSSDALAAGVNAGKWQGLGITLKLIDEILTEDDELDH